MTLTVWRDLMNHPQARVDIFRTTYVVCSFLKKLAKCNDVCITDSGVLQRERV